MKTSREATRSRIFWSCSGRRILMCRILFYPGKIYRKVGRADCGNDLGARFREKPSQVREESSYIMSEFHFPNYI